MHHSNPPRHHASITARAIRSHRAQLAREAAIRRHPAGTARTPFNAAKAVTT